MSLLTSAAFLIAAGAEPPDDAISPCQKGASCRTGWHGSVLTGIPGAETPRAEEGASVPSAWLPEKRGKNQRMADTATDRIDTLIEKGEDQGCVNLSELSEAIQDL